ncbi:ferritin-like domain-containing protein [Clostridium sp. CF012]|uniref:ferritin-like domain-containing protein n=1 Tax=Clostridium sp. CF012 TaxID=2843319 RepID=UPI001C0E3574|nr:ferritin-like domain-containing protein [Clostridium sp. CF012]MBU3144764.1 ferritin-like domain-containing protein [Clostridium sp. CF012]
MKCLICGMNININNFSMNKVGLLETNERDHIKYCPFCGVSAVYLKPEDEMNFKEEMYKVPVENLDKDTLIILEHAMKLEIFNSEFYKAAVKLAHSLDVKETFEALSKIEYVHALVHQKLGGFKQIPTLVNIDYSKHKSDKSLMDLAENREIHAVMFYEKQGGKINNSIVKQVFHALAEVEREHIQIARNY